MHNFYRGKDCIETFCKNAKELAMGISNYREQEMRPLTDKEIKFYKRQKVCHICKKGFCYNKNKGANLKYSKRSETIVILQGNLEELLIILAT